MGRITKRPKMCAKRRRSSLFGEKFDLQKWIGKRGIESHWPGYQYMEPGTKLEKRLKRGDPGINRLDRIAKQHDIDYSYAKKLPEKWKADKTMVNAISKLPGKKTTTQKNCQENHASQENTQVMNMV